MSGHRAIPFQQSVLARRRSSALLRVAAELQRELMRGPSGVTDLHPRRTMGASG